MSWLSNFSRRPKAASAPPSMTSAQTAPNFAIQSTHPMSTIAGAGTKSVAPIGPQGAGRKQV